MMRISIGYPSREKELEMLDTHGVRSTFDTLEPVVTAEEVLEMQRVAAAIHVAPSVKAYIVDIVETTRSHGDLLLGASPRSALFLQRVARVRAALAGREYVTPDDVKSIVHPVLQHRMALRPEALMRGATVGVVVDGVMSRLRVPGTRTGN